MNGGPDASRLRFTDVGRLLFDRHQDEPEYASRVIRDLLRVCESDPSLAADAAGLKEILRGVPNEAGRPDDSGLKREIVEYYIPKQLVDAIVTSGSIPRDSVETKVGVGFIDVADYTFLAKFLSAKENQILLNGLYTAFALVLKEHGGYLNKIEGDSIMFHYGGVIDPVIKDMGEKEQTLYISKELFYTCVEMQRVCYLFNQADQSLVDAFADTEAKETVQAAFDIISNMRNDPIIANSFNALFQIRIRIGANVGEVRIGNFGPPGRKVWDVIGIPVIDAKRMEATAPAGGLRISEPFYDLLKENGIVDSYFEEFRREAEAIGGYFRHITREELFLFGKVVLKDKRNVEFRTYSVQVNPNLPETIQDQIRLLLRKGEIGAEKIVELLQYYRGNKHIVNAAEDLFNAMGLRIRKHKILHYMHPKAYRRLVHKQNGDKAKADEEINRAYSLFDLFRALGDYQDRIKKSYLKAEGRDDFGDWENYMSSQLGRINLVYKNSIRNTIHNTYFYNVVFPLVFKSIKASILEFSTQMEQQEDELEPAEEAV